MLSQYADWINFLGLTRSEYLSRLGVLPGLLKEAGADDPDTIMILYELNAELDQLNAPADDGQKVSSPDQIRAFARSLSNG